MNCHAKNAVVGRSEEGLFGCVEMRVADTVRTRACELMAKTETLVACKNLRFHNNDNELSCKGSKIALSQAALTKQNHLVIGESDGT
jgi:hypothetical protein